MQFHACARRELAYICIQVTACLRGSTLTSYHPRLMKSHGTRMAMPKAPPGSDGV
jgi:hypothetical protein